MTKPQRHYSLDDYFAVEEASEIRHEFYRGEIFAMAGSSLPHNDISANVLAALRVGLRGKGCRAFGSDLRIVSPSGLHTYPDVSVVCGRVELLPNRPDTATNPVAIVEVLSPATQDYDRGDKFTLYKEITSLREYVLIEQDRVSVEYWWLGRERVWRSKKLGSLRGTLKLRFCGVSIPLSEVYREVFPSRS
jgi:Uma2 family endonuclease